MWKPGLAAVAVVALGARAEAKNDGARLSLIAGDREPTQTDKPSDEAIASLRAKIVAEPSGAATVAAALRAAASYTAPVVAIVSGGNLDPGDLAKYL